MPRYDFCGYATKNDLRCSDGRTIRKNAFIEDNGKKVPLVWQHMHNDSDNVLGHAILENREDGVYAYCTFNNTEKAKNAKEFVKHGDIDSLSIYANKLQQNGGNVLHGSIKEVSLVLAGANPGAHIEEISISHADGSIYSSEDEAIIFTGESIFHSEEGSWGNELSKEDQMDDKNDKTLQDVIDTMNEEQKKAMYAMVGLALDEKGNEGNDSEDEEDGEESMSHGYCDSKKKELEHSKEELEMGEDATIQDVIDTMNEEQKKAMYALVGMAIENQDNVSHDDMDDDYYEEDDYEYDDEMAQSDFGGNDMKYNVFEENANDDVTLSHAEVEAIFNDAKQCGSLREAVLAHTATYGIDGIDVFFPDAQLVGKEPELVKREDAWVSTFMDEVHKSPFARIKSIYANLTATEARAKGYIKSHQKVNEVIQALKRVTNPQTIYKLQKLDRDDIVDITDFDTVAFLKAEMRMMLNEEVARACLVGDGRLTTADDKINPLNVRPIYGDDSVYTIYKNVTIPTSATNKQIADLIIENVTYARENYKGSGSPVMFLAPHLLAQMLLAQDSMGRRIYNTEAELASALRVTKLIECPVMDGVTRVDSSSVSHDCLAIIVNLKDYNIGTDKGGAVNMFDDFDIDYNQYKYLIETRCSGALIKPYSAIAIEKATATTAG